MWRRSCSGLMNHRKNIRAHERGPASEEIKQNRSETVYVRGACNYQLLGSQPVRVRYNQVFQVFLRFLLDR